MKLYREREVLVKCKEIATVVIEYPKSSPSPCLCICLQFKIPKR